MSKKDRFKEKYPELFDSEVDTEEYAIEEYAIEIMAETNAAIMIDEGVWLPKSQIKITEHKPFSHAIVTVPNWLAKEKGLI